MKSLFTLASACILAVGFSACDSHSWDETKVLFSHGDHGEGDHGGADHADPHHKDKADGHEEGDQAHPKEAHGDKKDH